MTWPHAKWAHIAYGDSGTNSNLHQNGVHLLLALSPLPNQKSLVWRVQTRARAAVVLQALQQGEQGLLSSSHHLHAGSSHCTVRQIRLIQLIN